MRRSKLAQITLYIILGLILVFVVGLGVYFVGNVSKQETEKTSEKTQELGLEFEPVEIYMRDCIKKSVIESAYEFGQQQGYFRIPEPVLSINSSSLAYYYYKSKNIIPSNDRFQEEFSRIMEDNVITYCSDFSIFENTGFSVKTSNASTSVRILEDKVIIDIDYPLDVTKDQTKANLKKFSYTLQFRIGHIINISRELVDALAKEPYALDLTLLLNYDVDISVIHYDKCHDIYIINDNESKTKPTDFDYVYFFATELEDQYCSRNNAEQSRLNLPYLEIQNHNPMLGPIPYLTAEVGKEFDYKFNAYDEDNDTVFYTTDGITQNVTHPLSGAIKLVPNFSQIGIYKIIVNAVDINSGTDSREFYLEVK